MSNSTDYSLRLSLIVLDAVRMFKNVHTEYSGTDLNGHPYSIQDIEDSIVQYVLSLPTNVYSSKYIKGGYRNGDYFYIDSSGTLSSSEVDIVTQLELYRLFLECNVPWDINSNIKSLMSYEFKGFQSTFLMPNKVKASDILLSDTSLTIDPAILYFHLLSTYPDRFLDAEKTKKNIMLALESIKSTEGYYKYDYSLGGYTYSSNQYLESYLDGFIRQTPRTMWFDEITLFRGSNTHNLSVINQSSGKALSRVEYSIERVDTTLDPTKVVDICSDIYATQESVSESIQQVEDTTNQTLEGITNDVNNIGNNVDNMSGSLSTVEKDINDLKSKTTSQSIINTCIGTFYTKSEVDSIKDDTYVYVNQHITAASQQMEALSDKDKTLEDKIKALEGQTGGDSSQDVTALQTKVTALETEVATLKTTLQNNASTISTLDSKVTSLTTTIQEQAALIATLQQTIVSIQDRLTALEGE